jgi:hypothetical protein
MNVGGREGSLHLDTHRNSEEPIKQCRTWPAQDQAPLVMLAGARLPSATRRETSSHSRTTRRLPSGMPGQDEGRGGQESRPVIASRILRSDRPVRVPVPPGQPRLQGQADGGDSAQVREERLPPGSGPGAARNQAPHVEAAETARSIR